MRYGMNPHQAAEIVDTGPLTVRSGEPSLINMLDAINSWLLVSEAAAATGRAAAASFKHVSPAGAALAGQVDGVAADVWGVDPDGVDPVTSAYVRARDADPKSSFGDVVAVSEPVTMELATLLSRVVSDAVVAPGFEPGAMAILHKKQSGRFLVVEADPTLDPPVEEVREVGGVRLRQDRDRAPITAELLRAEPPLAPGVMVDGLLGMVTARYTQSNSVVVILDGASVGVGAGQQNRVDCVRLALAKARVWSLRRHPKVRGLPTIPGMRRQDRLNWQMRFAEQAMTPGQVDEFEDLFGAQAAAEFSAAGWREEWMSRWSGLTMVSDGFLPFRDNIDVAAAGGVTTVIEPGGSAVRQTEIAEAARELGLRHLTTGLRLFHH